MTAALVAVAREVFEKIQHAPIPFEYDLTRSYGDFEEELKDLDTLHIDVIAEEYPLTELETRGSLTYQVVVAIAVRKKFGVADQNNESEEKPRIKVEEVDDLVGVTQLMHDFWLDADNRRLPDGEYGLTWESTTLAIACSRKMLRESHQYLGLVRLTYTASKAL